MVIIGISLGAAGKYWQNVVLRDKEEELLFRGDQYRQAIERYYFAVPGRPQYPKSIEDLLADSRTPSGKRHLRKKYQDPISGEDFEIITTHTITAGVPIPAPPGVVPGIIGVHSKSDREPLKKGNFPDQYPDFAGKGAYHDWRFVSTIKAGPPGVPGRLPIPRPPGQIR
jgi:type II secretory pathway pseudopilin PulG